MNFTDAGTNSTRVGGKSPDRKSNMQGESMTGSKLDKAAMDMATKSQERIHHNEQTNSSNTTFSK